MLDLDRVRAQFPALDRDFVFFDNAGGSQTLGRVADRVRDYLLSTNVQLGASYQTSLDAAARVGAGLGEIARHVRASGADEIVVGPSTTQIVFNLAAAMAPRISPGDEIVVTRVDHEANVGAWRRLAAARGARVVEWRPHRETLRLRAEELAPLLGPRTRLVCFGHVSNVVGSIHDVAGLTRLCHAHGAEVFVDGVAWAPHRAIDVAAWDVDYYVFSLYKVFGPHLAALYAKRERLDELTPINHDFIGREAGPYRFEPGNVCFELVHAAGGVFEYLNELGPRAFDDVALHEEALAERLLAFLRACPRVSIVGEARADRALRVPTVSFVVQGSRPEELVRVVDRHRIGVRHGDFYARRLVADLGLADAGGVVRVSMAHYNSLDEVDRLVRVLEPLVA